MVTGALDVCAPHRSFCQWAMRAGRTAWGAGGTRAIGVLEERNWCPGWGLRATKVTIEELNDET